jgi:peptidoglycan hydrolase-like protein with peptidoglycan-binding domain
MSAPAQAPEDAAVLPPEGRRRRPRRRKRIITSVVVVVVVAAAGGGYYAVKKLHNPPPPPTADPFPTALQAIARQSLSGQTSVNGTLVFSGSYTVLASSAASSGSSGSGAPSGVFTWLPADGQVIGQGQQLYAVANQTVVLLYGSVPIYRGMSQGMRGPDVQQLNNDLVALGYASKSLNPTSDYFSSETATALQKLQSDHGLNRSGTLPVGEAVFEPSAVRVGNVTATLGAPVHQGTPVLTGTSGTRQAVAQVKPTELPNVSVGAKVSITLPNNQTTPGVVTSIGTTASSSSSGSSGSGSSGSSSSSSGGSSAPSATVNVDINLDHPSVAGNLDQAPITVNITTQTVSNVLAVPIDALVSTPSGYGVEVAGAKGTRHIVPVTLGLFDDAQGLVQVTGKGLAAGQQVVVPKI